MSGHSPSMPLHAFAVAERQPRDSAPVWAAKETSPPASGDAGKHHDFDAIYEENFPFVWRSARRLGVAESALDDVVQEVFVVVHRRLASFEERASVKTWLFGILVRVVRQHRRTLRRKPSVLGGDQTRLTDVDGVADRISTGPHESAAKAEAARMLHVVLDTMTDDRREVFVLAELEQMSVPEIAEAIGANVNAFARRARISRTR
jgi:RNA polymerase sigma-70 factor (ECF subfamily)